MDMDLFQFMNAFKGGAQMKNLRTTSLLLVAVAGLIICGTADAVLAGERDLCYEVTVTNLTRGQVFTPVLVATHTREVQLFTEGEPADGELERLAEGGDVVPLTELLTGMPTKVGGVAVSEGGPFGAGASVTVQVPASRKYNRLSLASMLAITNDGFIALNGVPIRRGTYSSPVYDAGTENNDELVAHIPGPGGEGYNEESGEGFVHIHAGIHGIGDLPDPENLDWRNPAAKITSRIVRCDSE